MRLLLLIAALTCAAPAASAQPNDGAVSAASTALGDAPWRLVSMDATPAHHAQGLYTLTFRGTGLYSGEGTVCTRFGGAYQATGDGRLALRPSAPLAPQCNQPTDPVFLVLLEGATRFHREGERLVLSGPAGSLTFARDTWRSGSETMPVLDAGRASAYACGADGTFRLRTGHGDVEVWLSDALATRTAGAAPIGIYHVLAQEPAHRGARFAYGPVGVALEEPGAATLRIGMRAMDCTETPEDHTAAPGARLVQAEGPDWGLEVTADGPERVLLSFYDGTTGTASAATVERAPGQTVYRGAYGLVVTVTDEACPDAPAPARRVTVARPEGTSDGCTLPSE